jgi:hypothetical protein
MLTTPARYHFNYDCLLMKCEALRMIEQQFEANLKPTVSEASNHDILLYHMIGSILPHSANED